MENKLSAKGGLAYLSIIKNAAIVLIVFFALFTLAASLAQKSKANVTGPCTIALCNTSFENGTAYWTPVGNSGNTVSVDAFHGINSMDSLQLLSSGAPKWAGVTQPINSALPNQSYAFNMWVKGTSVAQGHAKINWYDSGNGLLQTDYIDGVFNGTHSNWLSISEIMTSPANTAWAQLFVLHGVDTGNQNVSSSNMKVDLITFKPAETACGTLCNTGFEQGTLYWNTRGPVGSQMIETTGAYEGLYALKSEQLYTGADPAIWSGVTQRINVHDGGAYRLILWAKTLNAVHGHVKVRWYNSSGGVLGTDLVLTGMYGTIPAWTTMASAEPIFAPSGATTAEVMVRHGVTDSGGLINVPGSTVWLDGVKFLCQNLCNGGFEDGLKYWVKRGTPDNLNSMDSIEGTSSLLSTHTRTLSDTPVWSGVSQKFTVLGNFPYTFEMYAKGSNVAQGHVKINWYDPTDNVVQTDYPVTMINGTVNSWTPATSSMISPASAVMAEILVLHGINASSQNVTGSSLMVDGLSFGTSGACFIGLICNGGFESGLVVWDSLGKFGSNILDTIDPFEGTQSLMSVQLNAPGDPVQWTGVSQIVQLSGDPEYDLTLQYKALNSIHGHVKIRWLDSGGNLVSSQLAITNMYGTQSTWTSTSALNLPVPALATHAEILVLHGVTDSGGLVNVPGSTLWVDAVTFSPSPL